MLLIISDGQASVERGFSCNKEILIENMHEKSLVAQRHISDYLTEIGGWVNFTITPRCVQYVSLARASYRAYLAEQKKDAALSERTLKRNALMEEIRESKAKK
jgi:hypothetical protein